MNVQLEDGRKQKTMNEGRSESFRRTIGRPLHNSLVCEVDDEELLIRTEVSFCLSRHCEMRLSFVLVDMNSLHACNF